MSSTSIGVVPVRRSRHDSESKSSWRRSTPVPVSQDHLSLWSRLLCRPEVYDPHVEAAPLTHLLDVNSPHKVVDDVEEVGEPSARGQEEAASEIDTTAPCVVVGLAKDEADGFGEMGSAMSSTAVENAVSDVEELDEVELHSNGEGSEAGESLLNPRPFHIFDTRRCSSYTSTLLSTWSPGATYHGAASLHGDGVAHLDGTPTSASAFSNDSVSCTERRHISRAEWTKNRFLMRRQTREAAKRASEYREAWRALVASTRLDTDNRKKDKPLGPGHEGAVEDSRPVASAVTVDANTSLLGAPCLTNEALQSLREGPQSLVCDVPEPSQARLGSSSQPPKQVEEATQCGASLAIEEESAKSCSSRSSTVSSELVLDDELLDVEAGAAIIYENSWRHRGSASPVRYGSGGTSSFPHRGNPSVAVGRARRTAAGKYPLGSRVYVERVMFAQRRQQEFALFALLTEAYRQAREAYLHLAQLYYYYIIPILVHHGAGGEGEVRGLQRSLLQCGSGSLRVFHQDFCRVVQHSGSESGTDTGGAASASTRCSYQVQPVDFQLAQYRFKASWRELLLDVKAFLGVPDRESASCSASLLTLPARDGAEAENGHTSPRSGSVSVAATILHSMELFERQRYIRSAAQEAAEWLCWYHYYVQPSLQSATSAEDRRKVLRGLVPAASPQTSTGACQANTTDAADDSKDQFDDLELQQPSPLEREYLPLSWTLAADTAQRERVLYYRHHLKLRAIQKFHTTRTLTWDRAAAHGAVVHDGMASQGEFTTAEPVDTGKVTVKALDQNAVATPVRGYAAGRGPGSGGTPTDAHETVEDGHNGNNMEEGVRDSHQLGRSPAHFSDGAVHRQNYVSLDSDDGDSQGTEVEDAAAATGTYPMVNVGCFGLSFFSIFD